MHVYAYTTAFPSSLLFSSLEASSSRSNEALASRKVPVHLRSSVTTFAPKLPLKPPRVAKTTSLTFNKTYCQVPKLSQPAAAQGREFSDAHTYRSL